MDREKEALKKLHTDSAGVPTYGSEYSCLPQTQTAAFTFRRHACNKGSV